jgi:hypothetical protein
MMLKLESKGGGMAGESRISYPFKAADSLMAEGKLLAKNYKISFNMLLTLLLEDAVEEWAVPGHELRKRPDEVDIATDEGKALT